MVLPFAPPPMPRNDALLDDVKESDYEHGLVDGGAEPVIDLMDSRHGTGRSLCVALFPGQ